MEISDVILAVILIKAIPFVEKTKKLIIRIKHEYPTRSLYPIQHTGVFGMTGFEMSSFSSEYRKLNNIAEKNIQNHGK